MATQANALDLNIEKYGFRDPEIYTFKSEKGLNERVIKQLSWIKNEPEWMLDFRLKAYEIYKRKPVPTWGGDLSELNDQEIYYYVRPDDKKSTSWDEVPAYIRNTFDKLGIPEAERKFLAGVGAQYECLSGDTRVYTARGLIPIQDIQPGDTVFSFDEESDQIIPSQVNATAFKGEREVFEVRVGTRTIKATNDHPFLTLDYQRAPGKQRGRYRRVWKYLHELKPGDLVAVAKQLPDVGQLYTLVHPEVKTKVIGRNQAVEYVLDTSNRYNSVTLPERTSTDLMWWLGLYMGDGFIHYQADADKAWVEFAIPAQNIALRAELAQVTQNLFGLPARNGDPNRMTVYSTILARFLEANGFGGTAHTKRIPDWVFTLPQEQILAFLGGYVDADGYVRDGAKNHDIVLTSANELLLQEIKTLSAQCGLPTSTIHRFESRHPFDENRTVIGYRMQIVGDFECIGCRSPQRTARLGKRKYYHDYSSAQGTTFRNHTNEFIGFVRIESITPAGIEPVYDIEVDGPHNFVAEGLIVHNSEVVYHNLHKKWAEQGVIFLDTDTALQEYPELFKQYFGTVIPASDNKYAALNSAVWSGGSFIYVPAGVQVEIPLQAYFRINAQNMGQFERTLIIVEPGAKVHYIEGCLPIGEQVSIGDQWVNIEAVRPGDVVINGAGMRTEVEAVRARPYRGDLIEIRPVSPGNTFRLTPEHPVLAVKRDTVAARRKLRKADWLVEVSTEKLLKAQPEYIEAGRLEEGDFLVFPVNKVVRDNPAYTEDVMRLLGYYLAEGSAFVHSTLSMPIVAFSLGADEREHIEEVKALIERITGKTAYEVTDRRKHGVNISVYSQELMALCVEACGKGAATKQLSKEVMELPPEKQAHLLETYFAGEGSAHQEGRMMIRTSTASRMLAIQIQELLARQGIYASILLRGGGTDTIQGRPITRGDQYTIYYATNKKWSEVRNAGDYFLVPVKKLRRVPYDGPVFNFEVVGTPNSYLARGFAVHNCTAPVYSTNSLHSAVVEIIVKDHAYCRYTTIQNWANNIYNLVTKRAFAYEHATMEWVDGNLGSRLTMKYPSVFMMGPKAKGEVLSIALAGKGQHQDTGAKMVHLAPETSGTITSKSISHSGGRATYRGLAKVNKGAKNSTISVICDALILDEQSRTDTIPYIEVNEEDVTLAHEATVGRIGEEQLFYLMSRGLSESEAISMVVQGFMEPFTKELPLEYAVEMNRLIQLEMEGSVG